MTEAENLKIANDIFQNIFGRNNPYSLNDLLDKFAFDIALPTPVHDAETGEQTWSALPNMKNYLTDHNVSVRDSTDGWMRPQRPLANLQDLLSAWQEINFTTTERIYDSENVSASDPIYNSQNVYRSTNCGRCKNILFCDGTFDSENILACQRSSDLNFCIRTDDSNTCSNCYQVICSGKISNSFFIQDCNSLHECMFCSHIAQHQFCIANMQFPEAEYFALKQEIINWILSDK